MEKKLAFTLAEVLVTLAIIGVVAAMTIPTLTTSTRGKEFEVAANKALSTLSSGMEARMAMDNQSLRDFIGDRGDKHNGFNEYVFGRQAKDLLPGETPIPPAISYSSVRFSNSNASTGVYILKDGMILHGYSGSNSHAWVWIDTNGQKGPTRSTIDNLPGGYTVSGFDTNMPPDGTFTIQCSLFNINEASTSPNDNGANAHPDIVIFAVDADDGTVYPMGQRTRNILATGNATIAQ